LTFSSSWRESVFDRRGSARLLWHAYVARRTEALVSLLAAGSTADSKRQ
jgi:hypothetical protein